MTNPYAPPGGGGGGDAAHDAGDTGDLFVRTLPSPALRAAGMCAVVTGILLLFMCFRFLLAGVTGTFVALTEVAMVAGGILELLVAWGVTGGRIGTWFLGIALTPVVGLLSLVTLLTGSFAGGFGGMMCIANVALLAVSFGDVRRIGAARAALKRHLAT